MITIEHLSKQYKDVRAVEDLSLSIAAGELFALLGTNGAGKTTTIKLLCGLAKPSSGDARLGGYSITHDREAVRNIIAVSPQETAIAPGLSARENLVLMAGLHGLSRAETDARIAELSERLHLGEILARRAGKLSGGWKRRLSIAMALVCNPKILFLDEPTLGLDVLARADLWDTIRALRREMTIVLTTHYMEEAEALADRVGVMQNGKLLVTDTVAGLCAATGTTRLKEAFLTIVRGGESR